MNDAQKALLIKAIQGQATGLGKDRRSSGNAVSYSDGLVDGLYMAIRIINSIEFAETKEETK